MIPSGDYILASSNRFPTRDAIDRATNTTEGFGLDASMLSNALDSEGAYADTTSHASQDFPIGEFGEDFIFHKLWIEDIVLGAVVTTYDKSFLIWSTHRTPQSIISITSVDPSNTAVVEQPPQIFLPTEERYFNLRVEATGPSEIAATYTFTTADGEVDIVEVSGFRTIVLAWRPQIPVSERWEWSTNIMTSYDSSEQRVQIRDTPRQIVDFLLKPSTVRESTVMTSSLLGWMGNWWAIPAWHEQRMVISEASAGDLTISVDTSFGDFQLGWKVILWESWEKFEVVNVNAINASSLELEVGLSQGFSKATVVMPVHLGMMRTSVPHQARTSGLAEAQVSVSLIGTIIPDEDDHTPDIEYQGYEVLQTLNYTLSGLTAEQAVERPMDILDNGQGLFEVQPRSHATMNNVLGWEFQTDQSIWDYRTWLATIKGRLKPFWVLTWTPDITITSPFLDYEETVQIEDVFYGRYFAGAEYRLDLAFVKQDGTILYRRIVGWGDDSLTLDSSLGFDGDMSDFKVICFLQLVRSASDDVNFNWLQAGNVQVSMPVKMVDA